MRIVATAIFLILVMVGLVVLALPTLQLTQLAHQALMTVSIVAACIAAGCFCVSHLTGNCSQVDKIWSLAPIVYVWIVSWYGEFGLRLVVMSSMVTLWGLRLTWNFGLKGGYHWRFWDGVEDYRWQVLREKPEFQPGWKWTVFNLLFISGYQNALILMMTFPIVVALQFEGRPVQLLDWIVAGAMLFFILFESVADWQQWNYQNAKRKLQTAGARNQDLDQGFLSRGLWSLCRHPNYFAEQAIWVAFYFFAVVSSQQWFNWSIVGCFALVLLFAGSSRFSEEISACKYPGYADYQRRVPRFFPVGRRLF